MAVLFLLAVAVQFAVPTLVLTSEPSWHPDGYGHHFGWQMYTGRGIHVRYVATMDDGQTRRIDAADDAGVFWGHVHYGSGTPKRLCDADPRRVTVIRYTSTAPASFSCR
jgi:hypothetical protein